MPDPIRGARWKVAAVAAVVIVPIGLFAAMWIAAKPTRERNDAVWRAAAAELRSGQTGKIVQVDPETVDWLQSQRWREDCVEWRSDLTVGNKYFSLKCADGGVVNVVFRVDCKGEACDGPWRLNQVSAGAPDHLELLLAEGKPVPSDAGAP
jgi:hypothetical protein